VGRVTSVLSDHNVNIASLAIARQFPGSPALTLLICDHRIPAEVVGKIAALDGITNVRAVSFGTGFTSPSGGAAAGGAGGAGAADGESAAALA